MDRNLALAARRMNDGGAVSCAPGNKVESRYFSRGRIAATRTGAGPYAYAIAGALGAVSGDMKLFQFGKGLDMALAGRPGVLATPADTSLEKAGTTLNGERVLIKGVRFDLLPGSDYALVEHLWKECSVFIGLAGDTTKDFIGRPFDLCHIDGEGPTQLRVPNQLDIQYSLVRFASTGSGSRIMFKKPVIWESEGVGKQSNLQITVSLGRAYALASLAARAAQAAGANTSGAGDFTPPADQAAYVDFSAELIHDVIG